MYSLFRSLRPAVTVELGAGYTTFWLAKAARDAMEEAAAERDACFDEEDLHRASWVLWDSAVGRGVVEEAARGHLHGTGALPAAAMRPYHPVFTAWTSSATTRAATTETRAPSRRRSSALWAMEMMVVRRNTRHGSCTRQTGPTGDALGILKWRAGAAGAGRGG